MALVVETGAGLANSNSYATESTFDTYCDDRAITPTTGDAEAALIRASSWIDNTYRSRFTGYRKNRRLQALEWPRIGAYVSTGNNSSAWPGDEYGYYNPAYDYIPSDSVPIEIVRATCEAAIRELAEPGSLNPDLERGGAVKRLKAGSVEIEYAGSASFTTTFQAIDGIIAGLLGPSSAYTARAGRG